MTDEKSKDELRASTTKVKRTKLMQALSYEAYSFYLDISGVERYLLSDEEITLGRDPQCTIILPFTDVSRIHARVTPKSGSYIIKDCESTNGIIVNGEQVPSMKLTPNDLIEIGSVLISFTRELKREATPE